MTLEITNATETVQGPHAVQVEASCSASVLSKHWLLSAAHCFDNWTDGGNLKISYGEGWDTMYDGPATYHLHPDFGDTLGGASDTDDDIALVELGGEGLDPLPEPASLYTDHRLEEGDWVSVIGYGKGSDYGESSDCADGVSGTRRIAHYQLTQVEFEKLKLDYGNQEICPGDSGAPWMVSLDGRRMVVSVTANRRPLHRADSARVRPKVDWFEEVSQGTSHPLTCPYFYVDGRQYRQCFETPESVRSFDAGREHACAVLDDGRIRCWGRGTEGQLGHGLFADTTLPVPVSASKRAVQVAAGGAHTCALFDDDTVECWGSNSHGQIGAPNGELPGGRYADPHLMRGESGASVLRNVHAITAGERHTCALQYSEVDLEEGPVDPVTLCWGDNTYGQLGDGTNNSSSVPRVVGRYELPVLRMATSSTSTRSLSLFLGNFVMQTDVVAIDAGHGHTCARRRDGRALCWGRNNRGQLGDGTTTNRVSPVLVSGLYNVGDLSAGYLHSCATAGYAASSAACWGWNGFGQLADGSVNSSTVPRWITPGLGLFLRTTAGWYHTCFSGFLSGEQKCAGFANTGALGSNSGYYYEPNLVDTYIDAVRELAAGNSFTCSVRQGGDIMCTGWNREGQLGQGHTDNLAWPYTVRELNLPEWNGPL